jgi:hypothetical protein
MKIAVAVVAVLSLVLAGGSAMAGPCLDRLNGKAHACLLKTSTLPPGVSLPYRLSFDGGVLTAGFVPSTIELQCSCATTGSFNNPKFDASPSKWSCLSADSEGLAVQGSVGNSGKINNVTGVSGAGAAFIFSCAVE